MGISGLYKWLDSIKRPEHVKKYTGKTLGIDTYSWLHKGAFSCAIELVQGTPTTKYVDFCMERVKMLQYHGITPYLVFDGDYLPSKASTEEGREARREESRQKGLALLGTNRSAAMEILQKAVDVTPLMARHVIEACKALGVQYVVAPYEADAQLYYLEKTGVIDGVISEDSDLLVFGVRLLVTKMGRLGDCVEVNRDDFSRNRDITLSGWTDAEFRMMAILSGCDYLPSIKGIGVKKAHGYVRSHKKVDRIVRAIRLDGKMSVPADYLEKFQQAELTFLHQRVWCPTADKMVMCSEPEEPLSSEALVFIGGEVDIDIARGVARGDLDPITKEPFNLTLMPKHTPKPLPTSVISATKKPSAKPITSFFATSAAHASGTALRTPLQSRSTNVQLIRKAFTAPRPGSSSASTPLMKKRSNTDDAAKTDIPLKKSRLFPPDENVKATGERSGFFQTPGRVQSRRPLGELSPSPVVNSIRRVSASAKLPSTPAKASGKTLSDFDKAIQASLSSHVPPATVEKELSDLDLAIKASLASEYLPPAESEPTSIQKVARSLKADFTFKASPPGAAPRKLAKFVERQRVVGGSVKMQSRVGSSGSGFLGQFRHGGSGAVKKMQIPHTVAGGESSGESQDSGGGEDFWGVGEEEGERDSQSQSGSQGRDVFGKGLGRFMLRR